MTQTERQYECVVFGATGYTGKYTAQHITTHLPTDFKWAVAGRSEAKLKSLVDELHTLNPDRPSPAIETAPLEKSALVALAKKTKVFITTVGPYHQYGTVVFEACAETGTHYLDVTGESPWVYDMVKKYHATAQKTGAIMIPQDGIESAPPDLACWLLASHIRKTLGTGTREVVHSIYKAKAEASGGTLSTVLTLFDSYSLSELVARSKPWSLSPVPNPTRHPGRPLQEKLLGLRSVPDLGILTKSITEGTDRPIVERSWGLHDDGRFYGPNFQMRAYMKVRNELRGFGVHLAVTFGMMMLLVPPVRWLLKKFVTQPGAGPSQEQSRDHFIEWRSIAHVDSVDPNDPQRAYLSMRWNGNLYHLTGVFLAEAALTIAREKTFAHELGGGVLTPSTLGEAYLDRLHKAGLQTTVKTLP